MQLDLSHFTYTGKGDFKLKDWDNDIPKTEQGLTEEEIRAEIAQDVQTLAAAQSMLYAQKRYSLLLIFQGMDAAGKDGMIRHVMTGVNPQGTTVVSFKQPTAEELTHDYLWRTRVAFPAAGNITIFNRSHYEEVLVDRVHPENLLAEHLPGIDSVADVTPQFWAQRYKDIRQLENMASRNGIVVEKFFLYLSKDEQKERFLDRIEQPDKNWKFSAADIQERRFWTDYQEAYQDAIGATATKHAPWHIIPADNKWFGRLIVSKLILARLAKLPLAYPAVTAAQKAGLHAALAELTQTD
ncbi:polyphosphate kinase 2 family protein [Lacticaseibacillus jixianensis]|uniref:Polyphosphate kinase 2 family protein n=1 Tax=Lacticaseibacillus jixianensis TaxID=2486012 RepID=A0ABW4BCN0_9LACO|nr:polyphosphate kinase 2 family protein [Lacticaseibacillus jixianensis]